MQAVALVQTDSAIEVGVQEAEDFVYTLAFPLYNALNIFFKSTVVLYFKSPGSR